MNDLQLKFAMTLVSVGLFFAYALPMVKEAEQDFDAVARQVSKDYVAPSPKAPEGSSSNVALDDLQK